MNKALEFKNWKQGGRYYVLKANKWVGFQLSVINTLKERFGEDFFLVIWSNKNKENDFYNIPFKKLSHLFDAGDKVTGKYPYRLTAAIRDNQFLMHGNIQLAVDIKEDYGSFHKILSKKRNLFNRIKEKFQ
jgi:hypothetical protein